MATEYLVNGTPAVRPSHPGRILKGILEEAGIPLARFARHLGVSRPTVYAIINETRPVTVDMAARLSRAFGNSTRFWLSLQANHDAWNADKAAAALAIEPLPHCA
ncbi:MAG: HigA family addiction module antitoxin [Hyphomicrobiaceae bacterium]